LWIAQSGSTSHTIIGGGTGTNTELFLTKTTTSDGRSASYELANGELSILNGEALGMADATTWLDFTGGTIDEGTVTGSSSANIAGSLWVDSIFGSNPILDLDPGGPGYHQIRLDTQAFEMNGGTYRFEIDYSSSTCCYINCTTSKLVNGGGTIFLTQFGTSNPNVWF